MRKKEAQPQTRQPSFHHACPTLKLKMENLQEKIKEWKRMLDKSNDMNHTDRHMEWKYDQTYCSMAEDVYSKITSYINKASLGGKNETIV